MSARVGRNDPCPCGSGLKYKQCHAGKLRLNVTGNGRWVVGALAVVVVAGLAWGLTRPRTRPVASAPPSPMTMTPAPSGTSAPANPSATAGATPEPWFYDAATNRHFDPNHGHWHDGPPPSPEARKASSAMQPPMGAAPAPGVTGPASGATPAPWTYDAANNQHWNPEHGHWHAGPPPPGSGSR